MTNINKIIKHFSILIAIIYFVSMIAGPSYGLKEGSNSIQYGIVFGPSYGWKGTSNNVKFEIVVHQYSGEPYKVMTKGSTYFIQIICQNDTHSVPDLNISLPDGFGYIEKYNAKKQWPWADNWVHSFKVKSPVKEGVYQISFNGKDVNNKSFNFEIPITVADDILKYEAEESAKKSLQERTVIIPDGKTIIFPKGFESENKRQYYFTIIGGGIGLALAVNSLKDNMVALIFPVSTMLCVAGSVVGALPGLHVDYTIYKNTDVGWINEKKDIQPPELTENADILYSSVPHDIYSKPSEGTIVGRINQGEFRRILDSKKINNSTWYKVKIEDNPAYK
jgi:hypothetical protein